MAGAGLALAISGCAGQAAAPSAGSSAGAAGAVSSAAVAPAGGSASGQVVKAAWVARTAGETLWPLAKEAGCFDKYGVNLVDELKNSGFIKQVFG